MVGLRLFTVVLIQDLNAAHRFGLFVRRIHWALEDLTKTLSRGLVLVELFIDEEVRTGVRLFGCDDVLTIRDLLDQVVVFSRRRLNFLLALHLRFCEVLFSIASLLV